MITSHRSIPRELLLCEVVWKDANFFFHGNFSLGTAEFFTFIFLFFTNFSGSRSCNGVKRVSLSGKTSKHELCSRYAVPSLHFSILNRTAVENKRRVSVLRRVMFMVTGTVHCVVVCKRWVLCFSAALKQRWGRWSTGCGGAVADQPVTDILTCRGGVETVFHQPPSVSCCFGSESGPFKQKWPLMIVVSSRRPWVKHTFS